LHLEDVQFPDRTSTNRYHLREDEETILVQDLVEKISSLYENQELLKQLASNTHRDFATNGKFAINTRNEKLTQVYAACNNSPLHRRKGKPPQAPHLHAVTPARIEGL